MQVEEVYERKLTLQDYILEIVQNAFAEFEKETKCVPSNLQFSVLDVSNLQGKQFKLEKCFITVEI